MEKSNKVFIACSLDGYIAGPEGEIDWLEMVPNPEGEDLGFGTFIAEVDALLMGRATFELVSSFDGPWPYPCPVYVWSSKLAAIPEALADKAHLVKGSVSEVLARIHEQGHGRLYIDGGATIQGFLREDLIDEMTLTTLPILLGKGIPLFGALEERQVFELVSSEVGLGQLVQSHYRRKRG
ncbi:MAG: dihydrofolate reductase family protein [Bacteroidota bacterium]